MPICARCEQKVPYQELDTHQRYCRRRSTGGDSSTSERLAAREALLEECLETLAERLAEGDEEEADDSVLPKDLAGIEGSNIRYSRRTDDK